MQLTLNGQPVRQRMTAAAELLPATFELPPTTGEGGAAEAGAQPPGSAQPPEGMLAELVSWGMLCEGRNELRYTLATPRTRARHLRLAPAPRARTSRPHLAPAPRARSARPLFAPSSRTCASLRRYTLADGGVVRAWLYMWHGHSRVVVFDVDGTITLNDGLGHVGNVLDQSFIHPGVCEFLCQLRARGYQPLFLTARAMLGPAGIERTRRYLFETA